LWLLGTPEQLSGDVLLPQASNVTHASSGLKEPHEARQRDEPVALKGEGAHWLYCSMTHSQVSRRQPESESESEPESDKALGLIALEDA